MKGKTSRKRKEKAKYIADNFSEPIDEFGNTFEDIKNMNNKTLEDLKDDKKQQQIYKDNAEFVGKMYNKNTWEEKFDLKWYEEQKTKWCNIFDKRKKNALADLHKQLNEAEELLTKIVKERDTAFEKGFDEGKEGNIERDKKWYDAGYIDCKKELLEKIEKKEQISEYTNYLLQRFNDYEVPLTMKPKDVRELLIKFEKEYNKEIERCDICKKPLIPDKEAVIFGTDKWDGHSFLFNCKCNNKNLRDSIV